MPTPGWTRVVIGLAAAIWLVVAIVLKVPVDQRWLRALGAVISVVVLLLVAFDRWMWRWPGVKRLVKRPVLLGTWKATLSSNWPGPDTGQAVLPMDTYLVIRQTYSRVSVRALFQGSNSEHIVGDIVASTAGPPVLWFMFRSEAHALKRDGNPPRRGAAALVVSSVPKLQMRGDYWTEGGTRGEVVTHGHSSHLYDDFGQAAEGRYA